MRVFAKHSIKFVLGPPNKKYKPVKDQSTGWAQLVSWRSRTRVLETKVTVTVGLEEVFSFFSKAENLERLTPASLHFEIISPQPIEMKVGATIDYRLRLLGVPFRWQSVITAWEPPNLFADDQTLGPYQHWHHEHRFSALKSGTEIMDRVQYRVAGGPIEPLIHALFVGPQLKRVFKYRERIIREIFDKSGSA